MLLELLDNAIYLYFKILNLMEEKKIIEESIVSLKEGLKIAPKIEGTPSGVEGLDELFFITRFEGGKVIKETLNGFPKYAVINITGVSDTGKSLIAEQFAIKQASLGNTTIFITVETPAVFLISSLRQRALAMGIEPKDIENNIVIIDAASYDNLREDISNLLDTLAYTIKKYKSKNVVIDSITGLYEAKEVLARVIVRKLFNFLKKWYQTAIFVSQKRSSHEEFSVEGAGGYAVPHIVDCNIALAKKVIESSYDEKLYKKPIGEMVRIFRIDGCRLCGHDTSARLMTITDTGLVVVGKSLSELRKEVK
jgi:KaiC domain protein